jgi:hypothetical protein
MKRPFSFGLDRFSGLYLCALFVIVFSIRSPHLIPAVSTIDSVALSQAVSGMLAIALNVWGSVIAIYVLATGVQRFQYVTGGQWLSDLINGVALTAAVAFAVWRQRANTRGRRPANYSRVTRLRPQTSRRCPPARRRPLRARQPRRPATEGPTM